MKKSLISLALLFSVAMPVLFCQDEPAPAINPGLGIYLVLPRSSVSLGFYDYPVNRICIPVRIANRVLIEPEFGFYTRNEAESEGSNKSVAGGLGLFWEAVFGRMVIAPVLRSGYVKGTYTYDNGGSNIIEDTRTTVLFGPALGLEYFLADRVSVGCELGLKYGETTTEELVFPSNVPDKEEEAIWFTDTGVRLRFYFGK